MAYVLKVTGIHSPFAQTTFVNLFYPSMFLLFSLIFINSVSYYCITIAFVICFINFGEFRPI